MFAGGGSLKASLTRVFSLAKNEQAMTQKDNCGECDLGFNPHQEHYRQVNLPSVLSSPNGEGNGINSITNLSPYRPIALTPLAKAAFTMAEILLSLTIIGVVAAITLPSLTGNINERTWNTQRKALYSRMSQAVALMPNVNGYGNYTIAEKDSDGNIIKQNVDDVAETFVTAGLSKVFKINNICDNKHFSDCGIPETIINLNGSKYSMPINANQLNTEWAFADKNKDWSGQEYSLFYVDNSDAVAFETQNGESLVVFYNKKCRDKETIMANRTSYGSIWPFDNWICANFIYDLNGKKGPNTVGKDMGVITVLSPTDSTVVMPVMVSQKKESVTWFEAQQFCKDMGDDTRLPILEEAVSIALNRRLYTVNNNENIWTITTAPSKSDYAYYVFSQGQVNWFPKTSTSPSAYCTKRI